MALSSALISQVIENDSGRTRSRAEGRGVGVCICWAGGCVQYRGLNK